MSTQIKKSNTSPIIFQPDGITQAQTQLNDALLNLLARQSFETISVQDLVKQAAISRSTFYLYYDNIRQLYEEYLLALVEKLHELAKGIDKKELGGKMIYQAIVARILDFILENHFVFNTLLVDNYDTYFANLWKTGMQKSFLYHYPEIAFMDHLDLKLDLLFTQFITGVIYLLLNGRQMSYSEIGEWVEIGVKQLLKEN